MTRTDVPAGEPGAEVPGDTNAPDIVGPTGEEMPVQEHDEVERRPGAGAPRPRSRHPSGGSGMPTKGKPVPSRRAAPPPPTLARSLLFTRMVPRDA